MKVLTVFGGKIGQLVLLEFLEYLLWLKRLKKWLPGYFLMKLWIYENHIWEYPGYQRFFLAWDEELHGRHERRSHEKKPLVQSALIYYAGWTLTLSLICQSNQWSQANSKVITKEGTTRWSTKSHTISRITSLSFHRNHCLKRNLVTVQFSLIYVALVWAAIHSSKFGSVNH